MKKIIAIIGSGRKRNTYNAVLHLEKKLKELEPIDFEVIFMKDVHLDFCEGCIVCFNQGEWLCPLKDDRNQLLKKIEEADGVIIASPNYAFHVSARIKNLIDRLAYTFHRPRFFGKKFMPIVSQGVFGGGTILKYLNSSARNMGFDAIQGVMVNTLEPMTEKALKVLEVKVEKAALRFYKALKDEDAIKPSLQQLAMFHMTRAGIRHAKVHLYDYHYFQEKGWFESDYYHQTQLSLFRKWWCKPFDLIGKKMGETM